MNKRKILVTALALSIIAILSVGTLAWFSDEDKVTNHFLVADSDDDTADEIFSVDVWENGKSTEGLTYEDILPGSVLKKEVEVKNTGYYDQYIRVIVTVSDAKAWQAVHGLTGGNVVPLSELVSGLDTTGNVWDPTGANYDPANDTFYYVLYYTGVLTSGKDIDVFDSVVIPEGMNQEQAAAFKGGFTIDVKAQAVQTQNVGNSAYEAFKTVGMGL